jgi:hypothetical protein
MSSTEPGAATAGADSRHCRGRARRLCRFPSGCAGATATMSSCGRCIGRSCCSATSDSGDHHGRSNRSGYARPSLPPSAPDPVNAPADYARQLADEGKVIADFAERRDGCEPRPSAVAAELNGTSVIKPELLDEVAALVEWPVALAGNFEQRFPGCARRGADQHHAGQPALFPGGGCSRPAAAALHHHDQSGKPRSRRKSVPATNG